MVEKELLRPILLCEGQGQDQDRATTTTNVAINEAESQADLLAARGLDLDPIHDRDLNPVAVLVDRDHRVTQGQSRGHARGQDPCWRRNVIRGQSQDRRVFRMEKTSL